jgi:hypothetical protein
MAKGDEISFDTHTANNATKEASISRTTEENECFIDSPAKACAALHPEGRACWAARYDSSHAAFS